MNLKMNLKPKILLISSSSVLAFSFLIFIALVIFGQSTNEASPQTEPIRIVSPAANAVVTPGQTILVTIEPGTGIALQRASAWTVPESSDVPQIADQVPFQVAVRIPEDHIGPITLRAVARDQNGNLYETAIRLMVEAPGVPQTISVEPQEILLSRLGDSAFISVAGAFPDGMRRNITQSSLFISTNVKVATVNSNGQVQAVAPGISTINVSYAGLSKAIPAKVLVFDLRGDLDGDNDVDQDDLNVILRALNTQSTGPGDPRDLNNDGKVDALDSRILVNLCSRARCATQ